MKITGTVEKTRDKPFKKHILVDIDEDDSLILDQALRAFDKYDPDDYKYRARLEGLKEQIHKVWALLHPS